MEKAKENMSIMYEARIATDKGKIVKLTEMCDTWRMKKETAEHEFHDIRSQRAALSDRA